jgi:hypothetical protein
VMHAVHNGLLLSVNHWQEELAAQGWGVQEQAHLPMEWLAMSALGLVVGAGLLLASSALTERDLSESSSTD